MPGMKITLSAAMRARDVSRPHAEHEPDAGTPAPRSRGQAEALAEPAAARSRRRPETDSSGLTAKRKTASGTTRDKPAGKPLEAAADQPEEQAPGAGRAGRRRSRTRRGQER
jgi:hypothetical protein